MATTATNTTTGASLIPEKVAEILVQPLQAESVVLNSGVQIFDSSAPLKIPTISGEFDAEFVGESELIPDGGAADFGELALMPTTRKGIKSIVRFTNELVRAADKDVARVLQEKLVDDVRRKLDDALLAGDGADDTITGILNQPNIEHAPLNVEDADTILDAMATLQANEITPTNLFISGTDFMKIRKLKDADGRYLLQSDLASDAPSKLHGVPVTVTNKLPEGTAIIGDMSSIAVVRDIDPQITVLTERYAEYDEIGVRVVTRYDLGVIRPEGVLILGGDAATE